MNKRVIMKHKEKGGHWVSEIENCNSDEVAKLIALENMKKDGLNLQDWEVEKVENIEEV